MVTLGMMAALAGERFWGESIRVGAVTLALVLPITLFVLFRFGATSAEAFAQSQDILVNVRIPHHARVDLWLDLVAKIQIAWIALGMILAGRGRLMIILGVALAIGGALTVIQVAFSSRTLALLFPWRVSAVLVPLATAVIIARLVAFRWLPLERMFPRILCAAIIGVLVAAGLWISIEREAYRTVDDEAPLMDFVRSTARSGDVYLLPVRIPDLAASTRGSLSSDFKPLAAKRADARIIPVDLQRFRLGAAVPIYVDFKSIPYKDVQVLEWYERLKRAERWHETIRAGKLSSVLPELHAHGVSHLVLQPSSPPLEADVVHKIYEHPAYEVYRLEPAR
jgi:hypothetical protein